MLTVYIAARDIGNYKDNTERLKEVLIESDIVLVESFREATTLFKALNINKDKECLIEFSEHTKKSKDIDEIITKIINCKTVTLISDCGTPILEDPGRLLLEYCYAHNIKVRPVAGVSSVTAAIMCLPFNFKEFYYAGLLPRDDREREKKLSYLKRLNVPVIILDTPYRLGKVLNAIKKVYSKDKEIALCLDITTESEEIIIDRVSDICSKYQESKKREFVIVIS
ncbi:SAM-dependent methyltransferase [Brachyspira hyodysenteriae]|uniref:SAM-dependent methyltransferase n=1 Tax=Brachyspira hyodysenteriae TaxID=159 RepID=UPI00063DB844|nr:SAM-dependent methyltransferase [Brachyspira hyodysenteriae]KLI31041.1 tetrapyrrole methylase [Brachyspira hyodysenteriae]MCZ9956630.1 SAM-dependent methyltransferase [Brachyspira hyodysenteriae]MDA0035369.1 SAM-dependent methyltransferase [Brachyspira hyodysenteriae]MDA0049457.1 SAM-dependent methyltransferase [Brachyspira hyodysenteriae]MDA0064264.1 SAM-dependent methyltransferase [Brachyspira hyodysenteriae]